MKKYFFYIFFFLVFINFVSSALTDNLLLSYDFNLNETTITDNTGNGNNAKAVNVVYTSEGYVNGGFIFDGTDDYFNITRDDSKTSLGKNWTISFWTKSTDDTSSYINLVSNATSQLKIFTDNDGSAYLWASVKQGATTCYFYTRNITIFQDSWQMLTFVYSYENNANSKIYLNGSEILGIDKGACSNIPSKVDSNILTGVTETLTSDFTGKLDNYNIWNRSLTSLEVLELYNSNGVIYGDLPPSLNLNTNLINNTNITLNSLTISYNGTLSNNDLDVFLCELYNNTELLNSTPMVNLSLTNSWILDLSNKEVNYYFKINCSNIETNDSIGQYNYTVDTINPIIATTFINNTDYELLNSITTYFNFTDTNLFSYNISFFNPANIETENYFSENINNNFAENLTTRTALSVGYNYSIKVKVLDLFQNYEEKIYFYNIVSTSVSINLTTLENLTNELLLETKKSNEAINMIWLILFAIAFIIVAIILKLPILFGISGSGFLIVAFNYIQNIQTNDTFYNYAVSIFFFILGILLILSGVIFQFIDSFKSEESPYKKRLKYN